MTPRDNLPAAFALMAAGGLLMASMDVAAKIASAGAPLALVVWARFVFHSLWMTPAVLVLARRRPHEVRFGRKENIGHAARGVLIVLSTAAYFAAIRDNPIPDAIAVFFVEPIWAMLLAALFLGERLRLRRVVAAAVAFAGVIVVLRPGGGNYTPEIFLALLAGLAFAGYIVATRISSLRGSPLATAWGTSLFGALAATPWALWQWQTPDAREWLLLAAMGALAAGGHLCVSYACRMANASLVSIFHYSEIIAAAAVSYAVFNYFPDGRVWAGFALIAGAKIALTILEMRDRQPPPP